MFEIPELARIARFSDDEEENKTKTVQVLPHSGEHKVNIPYNKIVCNAFPFVVLTSNGERELPPAFLRRCLRLHIEEPNPDTLGKIVTAHFGVADEQGQAEREKLIHTFLKRRKKEELATDQLLNAIYLLTRGVNLELDGKDDKESLLDAVLKQLSTFRTP